MLARLLGAALLASHALASGASNPDSDHSYLKITLPLSLKGAYPDGIRHTQALFGMPSFGGDKKIVGPLIYATPGNGETACDKYSIEVSKDDPNQRPIFLVDRGACDFVQKMRIAQDKGAVAVIIADNVCQCDVVNGYVVDTSKGRTGALLKKCEDLAKKSPSLLPGETCENGLPYMADDGLGGDIKIPSFLIDFTDAQALKDCWLSAHGNDISTLLTGKAFACPEDTTVVVQLTWDVPIMGDGDSVKFELWSSSDSEAVFKKEFANTFPKIASFTDFKPRYFVWDGALWGCTKDNLCSTQCTDGGYYCNPDPDRNLFAGVSGVDVVNENLREMCVWEKAALTYDSDGGFLWWEYVRLFAQTCHPGENPDPNLFNEACSKKVHGMIPNLSWDETQACVAKSWKDSKTTGRNVKLDKELADRKGLRILTLPSAVINGDVIRGMVTTQVVVTAVCAGFPTDKQPVICSCVSGASSSKVLDCLQSGCSAGQQLCTKDKKCYPEAQLYKLCALQCSSGESWCDSTSKCVKPTESCPSCPDSANPVFCPLLTSCVENIYKCMPPVDTTTLPPATAGSGGTSVATVLGIIIVVTGIVGGMFFVLWRRQRARLHDDVRAILSSYMPLEELDARGGVSSQAPMRRGGEGANSSPTRGGDESSQLI